MDEISVRFLENQQRAVGFTTHGEDSIRVRICRIGQQITVSNQVESCCCYFSNDHRFVDTMQSGE